jgi:hypothetical protein
LSLRIQESTMTAKNKLTVSSVPSKHRLSATERRAAQMASVATRQQELKLEAAERAVLRAQKQN